jgi:hypothetical protein
MAISVGEGNTWRGAHPDVIIRKQGDGGEWKYGNAVFAQNKAN